MKLFSVPKASDLWATPQSFFDKLNEEFKFTLDACALPESAKCNEFFTPESDGLNSSWSGRVWCNPPYSDIGTWMDKATRELESGRCSLVVFLVPSRTGTDWWHRYAQHHEIRWIRGRLKFNDGKGSANFDCCLVVMTYSRVKETWPRAFRLLLAQPSRGEKVSFRQTAESACKWATERDERLAHISRLQNEYRQFEETCEHWSTTDHPQVDGPGYRRCEWCGKEWDPT